MAVPFGNPIVPVVQQLYQHSLLCSNAFLIVNVYNLVFSNGRFNSQLSKLLKNDQLAFLWQ